MTSGGEQLYGELIPASKNFVNCSVPTGLNGRQIVNFVVNQTPKPIPIAHLSDRLILMAPLIRPWVCFGSIHDLLDSLASRCGLRWWMSGEGLYMEEADESEFFLGDFDRVVGKLMAGAQVSPKGRVPTSEYQRIANEIDASGRFDLLKTLAPKGRLILGAWNQKYSQKAIRTFADAIVAKQPAGLRRALTLRLVEARKAWKNFTARR